MKKKIEFTVLGRNEQDEAAEVKLKVVRPSAADIQGARRARGKAYGQALRDEFIVAAQVDNLLRKNGIWTEEYDVELSRVVKVLADGEATLKNPETTAAEGRKAAIDMSFARENLYSILAVKTLYDEGTAETYADQVERDYLVAACTRLAEGKHEGWKYFHSPETYLERKDDLDGVTAAEKYAELMTPDEPAEPDYTSEYQYLLDNKFINDQGRYIDSEGRFVDSEGELIVSEEGGDEADEVESEGYSEDAADDETED